MTLVKTTRHEFESTSKYKNDTRDESEASELSTTEAEDEYGS
jgi:hypothetical protein